MADTAYSLGSLIMLLQGSKYITKIYCQIELCSMCQKCDIAKCVHNSFPFIPLKSQKNQFCARALNKSLSLIVSKMLTGPNTKFCIVLVRIQLFGSVIWQQCYIQRIWLYQWKTDSFPLCER